MYESDYLSGRLREHENKGKVQLSNPKGGPGYLQELLITEFNVFKRGFSIVFVTRAGHLQEWSRGELRL